MGAVLLQKRQKREPQWRRWWVKYPISPGGVCGQEESWAHRALWRLGPALGMHFDLGQDRFAPDYLEELRELGQIIIILKLITPS